MSVVGVSAAGHQRLVTTHLPRLTLVTRYHIRGSGLRSLAAELPPGHVMQEPTAQVAPACCPAPVGNSCMPVRL
jgi:hypothetical protein